MKQTVPDKFESFIQQYLIKALDWTQKKSIDISKVGNVSNILKYADGTQSKEEFCVRLIYSFGYSLEPIYQNDFATKVGFFGLSLSIDEKQITFFLFFFFFS